ncbi:MAG: hypothetical protein ACJAS9_001445 [Polaribacter sp.]|jgi:hypothetical protein
MKATVIGRKGKKDRADHLIYIGTDITSLIESQKEESIIKEYTQVTYKISQ